jgi:2-polyprenyl-3-methyl-5-hydroxy-6-metoxy-1,4-benzoquinol methylase
MKEFWNNRYAENNYAYGCDPNEFLKDSISKIPIGKILFPAEGQGRNAVFTAQLGYDVFAFDISEEGKKKALELAKKCQTTIDYQVGLLENLNFSENEFDTIVLIYAHVPAEIRKDFHLKLLSFLKPGGMVLFEAFSKQQLRFTSGGPKDLKMLFSEDDIKKEFPALDFLLLKTVEIELNEGQYHQGKGSVIRFIGRKK